MNRIPLYICTMSLFLKLYPILPVKLLSYLPTGHRTKSRRLATARTQPCVADMMCAHFLFRVPDAALSLGIQQEQDLSSVHP